MTQSSKARIIRMSKSERWKNALIGFVGGLIFGGFLLLIPIVGWILGPIVFFFGCIFIPVGMIKGEENLIAKRVGICPYCEGGLETQMSTTGLNCNHCKQRVLVKNGSFTGL